MADETRYSYAAVRSSSGPVVQPSSLTQLIDHVAVADSLLVVGSAQSLDAQGLHAGLTIETHRLPHTISVQDDVLQPVGRAPQPWPTATTTAWTPWEPVLRATLGMKAHPEGWQGRWHDDGTDGESSCTRDAALKTRFFMPFVMPSCGRITVGGSISADTIWRLSTVLGKESHSLVWIDVLLKKGTGTTSANHVEVMRIYNPDFVGREPPEGDVEGIPHVVAPSASKNDLYFSAIVGGFGLLGVLWRAKYALLELARTRFGDFAPTTPLGVSEDALDDGAAMTEESDQEESDQEDAGSASKITWATHPFKAPPVPHATFKPGTIKIAPRSVFTWMWKRKEPQQLFSALVAARPSSFSIPRVSSAQVLGTFGLIHLNTPASRRRYIVGKCGFGRQESGATGYPLWKRRVAYNRLKCVFKTYPHKANGVEWSARTCVHGSVFDNTIQKRATANRIPGFAFFMEGHAARTYNRHHALLRDGDSDRTRAPLTLQQAWTLELTDLSAAELAWTKAMALLVAFSSKEKGRVPTTACDVKYVPWGHALMASNPNADALVVTIAIEKSAVMPSGEQLGDPRAGLETLTESLIALGFRPHLTKNLFVLGASLRAVYADQLTRFRAVKDELDPTHAFGSRLWEFLTGTAPRLD